jgi:hypothetical protein
MVRTFVALAAVFGLWTGSHGRQLSGAGPGNVTLPTLSGGSVWRVTDSAECENRLTVVTRNVKDRAERDREQTALDRISTELDRQVTIEGGPSGLEGTVSYVKAVLSRRRDGPAEPLPVQGKSFPFAVPASQSSAVIKADAGAEANAIVENDRVARLLAAAGAPIVRLSGSEVTIGVEPWAVMSGGYLGPAPSAQCRVRQATATAIELECPRSVEGYATRTIGIRLTVNESGGWLAAAEVRSRREKETSTRAATPDDEVVTIETQECTVRTAQRPAASI